MQDRAGEYNAALKVCRQWTSAEPESPGKTLEEYEAELDRREAEADAGSWPRRPKPKTIAPNA
jgi:hypothetical protein